MSIAGLEQKVLISVRVEAAQARDSVKKLAEGVAKVEKEVKQLSLNQKLAAAGQAFQLLDKHLKITDSEMGKVIGSAVEFGKLGGQIAGPWGAAAGAVVGALMEIDGGFDDVYESAKRYQDSLRTAAERTAELIKESSTFNWQLKQLAEGAHSLSEAVVLVTAHLGRLRDATATFESLGPVLKAVNDQLAAQKRILGEVDDPRANYVRDMSALDMLLKTGKVELDDYATKQRALTQSFMQHEGVVAKTVKAYKELDQMQTLRDAVGGFGRVKRNKKWAEEDEENSPENLIGTLGPTEADGANSLPANPRVISDKQLAAYGAWQTATDKQAEAMARLAEATRLASAENQIFEATMGTLGQVAGSVYSGLIDGTVDLGTAVKRAAADSIKALGLEFLVKGVGEIAAGVAAAASPAFATAPAHFTAGAKYLAAAGIAGVAAAALGTSAANPAPSATKPSAPSSGGSGSYQGGGQNVTIVYGDQFADDSPRNRQRTAQKLVSKALGSSGGTYS